MVAKVRANKELRSLIQRASHIPLWKPSMAEKESRWVCAGYGTTEVSGKIAGKIVTLKGRMVIRNSSDGHVPVFTFDSFVDGKKVSRRALIEEFSEPA